MRQTLHIFGKDARHCWPFIAVVLALTAVNAWRAAGDVPDSMNVGPRMLQMLFTLAVVATWWLAISTAVHGESLVGDRQFWVTRPYSWKSLLGAKLLFIGAFLALPMFLSDCSILAASGFSVAPLIPGLLLRQCWLAAFLVLPFVLAALTQATRDFALSGIGFYVYFFIVLESISFLFVYGSTQPLRFAQSWILTAAPWLVCAAGLCLAAWQFPRRRTALVRVLAIAIGVVMPVLTLPALYYRPGVASPSLNPYDPRYRNIAVEFAPGLEQPAPHAIPGPAGDHYAIPVRLIGWPQELLSFQHLAVSLIGPKGEALVSYAADLAANSGGRGWLLFRGDEMARQAASVELSFDLLVYERKGAANLRPGGGWTNIPPLGSVRRQDGASGHHMIWRTALRPLEPGWAYSFDSSGYRGLPGILPIPGGGPAQVSPLLMQISPVYSYTNGANSGELSEVLTVCRWVATLHRDVRLPPIRLADYQLAP